MSEAVEPAGRLARSGARMGSSGGWRAGASAALVLALAAVCFLHGWWNGDLPATPRLELTPELGHIWQWQQRLREGEGLAAWNHQVLTGEPVLTSRGWVLYAGLGLLSLGTGLSPDWLLKLMHLLSVVLAGWGMMAFARRLGSGWPGALVAGMVYALFPMTLFYCAEALFHTLGCAGMPWGLWGYERWRASRSRPEALRSGALWGLALAWAALASVQLFMLEGIVLAAYVGVRELGRLVTRGGRTRGLAPAGGLIVAAGVAAGVSLYFYLPSLLEGHLLGQAEHLRAWPRETVLPAPLPLLGWVLGHRFQAGFQPLGFLRFRELPDFAFYLGWSALALALVGLVARRRQTPTWALAGVVVVSFLLAIGPSIPYNPVYWLIRRLPVLADLVRHSFRSLVGVSLGLAGLAALGVDGLLQKVTRPVLRWGLAGVVIVFVAMDFWPGSLAYRSVEQYLYPDEIAAHQWLDVQGEAGRYWVPVQVVAGSSVHWHYVWSSMGAQWNRRPAVTDNAFPWATFPRHAWQMLKPVLQVLIPAVDPEAVEKATGPLPREVLSLVNVRYGLVYRNEPVYEEVVQRLVESGGWRVLRQAEHVYLLENPTARPYLQAYRKGVLVQGGDEALQVEWLPGCLERGYALVERMGGREGTEGVIGTAGEDGCGSLPAVGEVEVQLAGGPPRRDAIRVEAEAGEPFVLMVAESWYPHWKVEVDGERAELLRVNGGFLGVAVQGGAHEVVFRFCVPWYQKTGLVVSSLTLLGTVVWVMVPRSRRLGGR
ncbi:MAG: hypothetical protein ACUVXG_06125 [Anaerolineae bacterium]